MVAFSAMLVFQVWRRIENFSFYFDTRLQNNVKAFAVLSSHYCSEEVL
jgi:hypothetical protein